MAVALTSFLKYVRTEVPGCPEPMLTDAVLRAAIDFCTRSELLSEIVELDTVDAVSVYAVASSTPLTDYPARLRNVLKDGLPLTKSDAVSWAELSERTDAGLVTHYYAPTRAQLALAPVPNAVETLELDLVLRPDRDATTLADVLYEEWVDAIASGAKALLLAMPTSWSNPPMAAWHQSQFDDAVDTAAVQAAMGNVGSTMRISPMEI